MLCVQRLYGIMNGIEVNRILEGISDFELTKNRMEILDKNRN